MSVSFQYSLIGYVARFLFNTGVAHCGTPLHNLVSVTRYQLIDLSMYNTEIFVFYAQDYYSIIQFKLP